MMRPPAGPTFLDSDGRLGLTPKALTAKNEEAMMKREESFMVERSILPNYVAEMK